MRRTLVETNFCAAFQLRINLLFAGYFAVTSKRVKFRWVSYQGCLSSFRLLLHPAARSAAAATRTQSSEKEMHRRDGVICTEPRDSTLSQRHSRPLVSHFPSPGVLDSG